MAVLDFFEPTKEISYNVPRIIHGGNGGIQVNPPFPPVQLRTLGFRMKHTKMAYNLRMVKVDSQNNRQPKQQMASFKWLGYGPYIVTKMVVNGDILTGPMAGCWLVTWNEAGATWVAHVGTGESADLNKVTKEGFARQLPKSAMGFLPDKAFSPHEFTQIQNDYSEDPTQGLGRSEILGLVTANGDCFAIQLLQARGASPETRIVGGIKQLYGLPFTPLVNSLYQ